MRYSAPRVRLRTMALLLAALAQSAPIACSESTHLPSDSGGHPGDAAPDTGRVDTLPRSETAPGTDAAKNPDALLVDSSIADTQLANPPPWPEWAFHHWVWEDESTQQSALDLVNDYLAHNIPVGAIIIDSPWETGYNTFEWDSSAFPDPQQMINDLHAKNVRVMLWIVPAINTDVQPLYSEAESKNFLMKLLPFGDPAVVDWWKGEGSLIDYFNPQAVTWWHALMDKVLAYDIDGWKCDGLDIASVLTPWSPGKASFVWHLAYSDAYYRDFFDYTRQKLGNDRIITARPVDIYGYDLIATLPFIPVNEAAFAPREINWAGWVGDQDATFEGLRAALLNMYHSSQLGYIAFGSDIGGYREDDTYPEGRGKEIFIRWAQLGAFNPVMENGGGGEHRPWMFDAETTDIYRTFVNLHYALIPYLMEQGSKAWQAQQSLMTFFDQTEYRYLLGSDIFVAPMINPGTSRSVAFPAGSNWVYLFDKQKVYPGGTTATLTIPLEHYPVFLRQGSAIASTLTVP